MNEPIVLESNQNHATVTCSGISPTLPAAMGLGGGYVPMIVIQRRFSRVRVIDTEISPTLESASGSGGGNLPMILTVSIDSYNQAVSLEVTEPLRSAEGGDTKPKVLIVKDDCRSIRNNNKGQRRCFHQ